MRLVGFILLLVPVLTWAQSSPPGLILVRGGPFPNSRSNAGPQNIIVPDFLIGAHEVTQREWIAVMGDNPSKFPGDDLPVETVSWYSCVEYCNRRSALEGLRPYYMIDKTTRDPANENESDDLGWIVTPKPGADGYRLPTELEWEYAATGGQAGKGHTYSGGDSLDSVGWYWRNSGERYLLGFWHWSAIEQNHNQTKPVGGKTPNELGIHDLSGNVREWCWDRFIDQAPATAAPADTNNAPPTPSIFTRVWKGGGWMGGEFCCEPAFRAGFEPAGTGADQGFRVCRDADPK